MMKILMIAAPLATGAAMLAVAPAANADVYYPNCAAAIAAHAAPIQKGEPGYRPPLDRDNDGTACDRGLPAGYRKIARPAPTVTTKAPAPTVTTKAPAPTVTTKAPAPATAMPVPAAKGPVVNTDYVPAERGAGTVGIAVGGFAVLGAAGLVARRARQVR